MHVINTFCWITYTYTIPGQQHRQIGTDVAGPGLGNEYGQEKRYHSYYQWVPFVLFFQVSDARSNICTQYLGKIYNLNCLHRCGFILKSIGVVLNWIIYPTLSQFTWWWAILQYEKFHLVCRLSELNWSLSMTVAYHMLFALNVTNVVSFIYCNSRFRPN